MTLFSTNCLKSECLHYSHLCYQCYLLVIIMHQKPSPLANASAFTREVTKCRPPLFQLFLLSAYHIPEKLIYSSFTHRAGKCLWGTSYLPCLAAQREVCCMAFDRWYGRSALLLLYSVINCYEIANQCSIQLSVMSIASCNCLHSEKYQLATTCTRPVAAAATITDVAEPTTPCCF